VASIVGARKFLRRTVAQSEENNFRQGFLLAPSISERYHHSGNENHGSNDDDDSCGVQHLAVSLSAQLCA